MQLNVLEYLNPAPEWIEGMPLGNGRLGAMVLGNIYTEQIILNEDSVWVASAGNRNNKDAFAHLDEIRTLLLNGEFTKAQLIADAAFVGTPRKQAAFQPIAELHMEFVFEPEPDFETDILFQAATQEPQAANNEASASMENPLENDSYRRSLDIANALANVSFTHKGAGYAREYFTSNADAAMVARFTADRPAKQTFSVALYRRFDANISVSGNEITLCGQAGKDGVCFCTKLSVETEGSAATVTLIGEKLLIENADAVTLRITAQTDFRSETYVDDAAQMLVAANALPYSTLKTRHIAEYKSFFDRMTFTITGETPAPALPIDARLRLVQQGETDVDLAGLYFNFGRYLLISCSRPGSLPANLQGIWCDSMIPTWDSKYTININTEMNYWPAEVCNLSDCHMPLLDHIANMRENGRKTAREMYHCSGWVAHHNTDLWCDTAPLDHAWAGVWPMGGAWLCLHIWNHYEYSHDLAFLQETGYPTMKEAAEFFLDYMFEQDGVLMTGPSLSPEHRFIGANGEQGCVCCSPAMDTQILTGLFTRCLAAAKELGISDEFTAAIAAALPKLPPMKIGKEGQLQEWYEDYQELEPGHRHVSHLLAVYPEWQINGDETPELFAAARKSLETRLAYGGGGTGWSLGWLMNLWARFGEGEKAWETIHEMLAASTQMSLLDIHPPRIFQIDGNLGTVAGMAEMLLQVQGNVMKLFPALPNCWKTGDVTGLCAPNGVTVDLAWDANGNATATLAAKCDVCYTVLVQGVATEVALAAGERKTLTYTL